MQTQFFLIPWVKKKNTHFKINQLDTENNTDFVFQTCKIGLGRSQQKYSTDRIALVPLDPNTAPTNRLSKPKQTMIKQMN